MDSTNFQDAFDALRETGRTVLVTLGVVRPQSAAVVMLAAADTLAIVDLVAGLDARTVLMVDGDHGSFEVHVAGNPWVAVQAVTPETVQLAVDAATADEFEDPELDPAHRAAVLAELDALQIERHAEGKYALIDEAIARAVARGTLPESIDAAETAWGFECAFNGDVGKYVRERHAAEVRKNPELYAKWFWENRTGTLPKRYTRPMQLADVKAFLLELDPGCRWTNDMCEPVVQAVAQIVDARP